MYRQKDSLHVTYNYARANEASERLGNIYLFRSQNTCYICIEMSYTINVVPFYYLWYGAINDSILTHTNIEKIYEYTSELGNFSHFHIQKLLFLSIFCWSFRYFVGTNDMIPNVPTKLLKALWGWGSIGQSQFRNEINGRRGKADDKIKM